jgi:DNA-directed RNA polymerase specialized sigma24 family protein
VDAETADVMNGPDRVAPASAADADWAVTTLFHDHHLELVRLALVMVGDMATAEDVVQDAFEHLHRHWHRLREPASRFTALPGPGPSAMIVEAAW